MCAVFKCIVFAFLAISHVCCTTQSTRLHIADDQLISIMDVYMELPTQHISFIKAQKKIHVEMTIGDLISVRRLLNTVLLPLQHIWAHEFMGTHPEIDVTFDFPDSHSHTNWATLKQWLTDNEKTTSVVVLNASNSVIFEEIGGHFDVDSAYLRETNEEKILVVNFKFSKEAEIIRSLENVHINEIEKKHRQKQHKNET